MVPGPHNIFQNQDGFNQRYPQDRSVPDTVCSALVICSDGCFKQFQFGVARQSLRWPGQTSLLAQEKKRC